MGETRDDGFGQEGALPRANVRQAHQSFQFFNGHLNKGMVVPLSDNSNAATQDVFVNEAFNSTKHGCLLVPKELNRALRVDAYLLGGFEESLQRSLRENCSTLGIVDAEFEEE